MTTIVIRNAKSPVKSAGGKAKLLPDILSMMSGEKMNTYYEPFAGGAAVFFRLASLKAFKRAVLNDSNKRLMMMYQMLKKDPDAVIKLLKKMKNEKEFFLKMRERFNKESDPHAMAALYIYLNKTCFNGLHRVNKKGEFNVPFGDYANPNICDEDNLRLVSKALKGVSTYSNDFENIIQRAEAGDVVYCDSPYYPLKKTSFVAYGPDGFTHADQVRLRDAVRAAKGRGAHVIVSNSDAPEVRTLYKGFQIKEVYARRNINSDAEGRSKVTELLIT